LEIKVSFIHHSFPSSRQKKKGVKNRAKLVFPSTIVADGAGFFLVSLKPQRSYIQVFQIRGEYLLGKDIVLANSKQK